MTEPRQERRSGSVEPLKVGVYSPGIARIERIVADKYREHDEVWSKEDEDRYHVLYSHLNHCMKVRKVAESIARKLGLAHEQIQIVSTGAFLHDFSKVNLACREYRERRTWTETEREEFREKHQHIAMEDVLSLASYARPSDKLFITFVSIVVGSHHDWDRINVQDLRLMSLIVCFSDALDAMQEDRMYKPGLSQFEAVERLELDVVKMAKLPRYTAYATEMQRVLSVIADLYGPNSVIPIR